MYELHINKDGQVQQWWINFLMTKQPGEVIIDIPARFKEMNAELVTGNYLGDKIIFQREEDLVWFLLHWS
jgi:hypothetical protein